MLAACACRAGSVLAVCHRCPRQTGVRTVCIAAEYTPLTQITAPPDGVGRASTRSNSARLLRFFQMPGRLVMGVRLTHVREAKSRGVMDTALRHVLVYLDPGAGDLMSGARGDHGHGHHDACARAAITAAVYVLFTAPKVSQKERRSRPEAMPAHTPSAIGRYPASGRSRDSTW